MSFESRYGICLAPLESAAMTFPSAKREVLIRWPSFITLAFSAGDIPATIGRLTKLEYLDCNDNELKVLPPEIGRCRELQQLLAYRNQLKAIPKEFGNLLELNEVNLFNNKILAIPNEVGAVSGPPRARLPWSQPGRCTPSHRLRSWPRRSS